VAADGFGIGYIIKDDAISICASSKHLQTRRYLDTMERYLLDVQRMIIQLHRLANERPNTLLDNSPSLLRTQRTGNALISTSDLSEEEAELDGDMLTSGYSFFDSGDVDLLNRNRNRKRTSPHAVGKTLKLAEY